MSRYAPRASAGLTSVSPRGRSLAANNDYEEFASLQLDKPNEGELKTSEEMKRHMFDDHFEGRPIERAMHILAAGEEVQRLSVIRDLVVLIHTDEQGCLQRVIQKIHQALNSASTEFHIETARAFSSVLEKKAVAPMTFVHSFLPSIIFHVDNRDEVVSNAWLETLLKSAELLPLEIVKTQIFAIAINKGQISQNVLHRLAASKLLGKLCTRFDSQTVKKDLLPIVLSLCQDVNETVRASICSQLHLVAKGIPSDMIKPALIPILVELGRDETPQVRVEATETIVKIMPSLSNEVLKVTIVPLIKKICEQALLSVDDTLVMVAKQFGGICIGLESVLSHTEKLWMVNYYHNLSHLGIPSHGLKKDALYSSYNMDHLNSTYVECRQYCAYNFPAVAKFSCSNQELLEKIYPAFCDLSTDPYYMVRKTIGAGMHEVARILGPNNRVVKNQMITLLWDNMEEVLMGVVPNLSKTIEWLISSRVLGYEQDGVSLELGRGLLQCDKTIRDKTHNWRLYTNFITQLETVVKCLPSDYIYSHFVSLMFEKMHRARPLPCRLAAARTLLVFLRFNLKSNQRQEIRSRLQSEFCLSSSCYKRMLYLRLCNVAREVFSKSYFKEHFFFPLLSRSEDKVANNRILLIRQFPYLKAMIIMPSEKKYLQTLESCVRSMAVSEKDRDATLELRMSISKLDKTETLTEKPPTYIPEDIEDHRKYEEEMRIASTTKGGIGYQFTTADARKPQRETKPPTMPNNSLGARQFQPPPAAPGPGSRPIHSTASTVTAKGSTITTGSQSNSTAVVLSRPSANSTASSSGTPTPSPRPERVPPRPGSMSISSTQNISGQRLPFQQGFSNTSDNLCSVRSLSTHLTNIDQNCTCFPTNYRSENLRNLNLLALIDTNLMNSKQKISEAVRQKLLEDPRIKMTKSAKHNMEISWLNLETDIKNELFTIAKNRQIQGDRNFKEKSKFLTDFRNYNESTLRKFISEDKSTIYNVTGVAGCYERNSNFFEDRINFFERKIKLEDQRPNSPGECSCFELTSRKLFDDARKFSYFSKNFEEDFYRDAGVKANEIIGRKFSLIPVQDTKTQVSTSKISASVTNKRRTWFGSEHENQTVKLETITGYKSNDCEKKKSETLPSRESVSLKRIGIGPRSKSFVLPSTHIYNEKAAEGAKGEEKETSKPTESTDPNRFGFRGKGKPDTKEKLTLKTKIPVGIGNGSPSDSRSSSPCPGKQTNGTKKIPVIVSRKSMIIQSSTSKAEVARNNRRSLDASKNNLANADNSQGLKRRGGKENGTSASGEEKADVEALSNGTLSKLPVRRPKP